ncbi:MAG: glycosyl transferase, partial [Thermoleophilia bacterium]|nr:glycosyl transferase [Thermoleophilia bacterium]
CAHHDSLETRLSFRTRFLDHLWAGLPTISTAGGDLTDRMAEAGAALVVPELDTDAWADTLVELASDVEQREQMSVAARDLGQSLQWPSVVEPLVRIIGELHAARSTRPAAEAGSPVTSSPARGRLGDAARYAALLVRVRVQTKGVGSLREAARGAFAKTENTQDVSHDIAGSSESVSDSSLEPR